MPEKWQRSKTARREPAAGLTRENSTDTQALLTILRKTMELKDIKSVYFVGAGGIGMSAIARYFLHRGVVVAGYDKTPSALTEQLEREGMLIHYDENVDEVPHACRNRESTLVIYTPAIPADHKELVHFRENGFDVEKRAQVLGMLTRSHKGLCVAGTHGKTTTSSMCAHILHQSHVDCNAFLGGITKNYSSNYILSKDSDYVVIEADEFDRSFHWLRPWMSVITATDPDHLDIYGTKEAYLESFAKYTELIQPGARSSYTRILRCVRVFRKACVCMNTAVTKATSMQRT